MIQTIPKRIVAWWHSQKRATKIVISIAVVIVALVVVRHQSSENGSEAFTVQTQTLQRTVRASGNVASLTDLTLSFPQSKIVRTVAIGVGDKVSKGKILAILDNSAERAAVTSAKGALLAAEARYRKVLDGSSNEEIKLAQLKLENAKVQNDTLVESARRTLLSQGLVATPNSNVAFTGVPLISGTYTGTEGEYRLAYDPLGDSVHTITFRGVETGKVRVDTTKPQPLGTKGLYIIFPSSFDSAENQSWIVTIPNTQSIGYVQNLNAYNEALKTRDTAVAQAQAELDLIRATARQSDVDAALADVVTAQAGVQQASAALENTILRAPADGTITKVDIKVGEVPKALEGVITLQDVGNLYLESDVNESSIPLLSIGQSADVTFDAFGPNKVYKATISSIDPSATITDGVVNYKIKALLIDNSDIRPGMTANMTVTTLQKPGVLAVPSRAIITKDGASYVSVITDSRHNKTELRAVTLGATGDGDMVEVSSGLSENEKVVNVASI